jgi:uncharacterized protein YdeI (YjbR/CyaY-like superfamily)
VETTQDLPVLAFGTAKEFERWLAREHSKSPGLWLKIAKKASGIATVTYPEAVEIALCYGWIDGQKLSYDESYSLQRFTPRRAKSVWSQINVAKVEHLIAEGRMRPAGLAAVELAKADGRWDRAYASPAKATVPDDLKAALDADPAAADAWTTLDRTNRYAILFRIQDAKRAETRERRIKQYVEMIARGDRPYPARGGGG